MNQINAEFIIFWKTLNYGTKKHKTTINHVETVFAKTKYTTEWGTRGNAQPTPLKVNILKIKSLNLGVKNKAQIRALRKYQTPLKPIFFG